MGILVIQNKYNEEHSNAVVTHTYGNYNDAINAIKKFASKFFAVYNEGVDKDFDVKHREVSLHKILANAHSSYAEWRYDRYNSPIACQK